MGDSPGVRAESVKEPPRPLGGSLARRPNLGSPLPGAVRRPCQSPGHPPLAGGTVDVCFAFDDGEEQLYDPHHIK